MKDDIKNRIKAALIDEILHGKEISLSVSNTIDGGRGKICTLYSDKPFRRLFRWKQYGPSIGVSTNPIILKEALELVDTRWESRVEWLEEGDMGWLEEPDVERA